MNCKPGDLAYLISSDFPENVGHIVEVTSTGWQHSSGWVWEVVSRVPLKGWVAGSFVVKEATSLCAFDDGLRPINGVPVTDDALDEVTA